jgi:hypothetical protein
MGDTITLKFAGTERVAYFTSFTEGVTGLVAQPSNNVRKRHSPIQESPGTTHISFAKGRHKGPDINMNGTGRSAERLLFLDTAGFDFFQLQLIHYYKSG